MRKMMYVKDGGIIVNIEDLLTIVVYLFYLKPAFSEDIPLLDLALNMGRFGLSIVFIGIIILKRKKFVDIVFPLSIFLISLLSTAYHSGAYSQVFSHWIPTIGLLSFMINKEKRIERIIELFFRIGQYMIILNAITLFIFPSGMWIRGYLQIWFLGQKQDFVNCLYPTIVYGYMYFQNKKRKTYDWFVIALAIYTIVITKPLSLIICLFSFILVCYLDTIKSVNLKLLYLINIMAECISVAVAYLIATLPRIQAILLALPNSGLDKYNNMTTRFVMWTFAFESLKKNPLIGRGQLKETQWLASSGLDFFHTIVHNLPLDIALVGGGIALSLFILWNTTIIHRLSKSSKYRRARIIGIALFSLNILGLTECPYQPLVFSIYALPCLRAYIMKE